MKTRILFLDDDDVRHSWWERKFPTDQFERVHAHTIDEFVEALNGPKFDVVFLDHDLNDHPRFYISKAADGMYGSVYLNGQDAAHILANIEEAKWPAKVNIHSWNDGGAQAMEYILTSRGFKKSDIKVEMFSFEGYMEELRRLEEEKGINYMNRKLAYISGARARGLDVDRYGEYGRWWDGD